VNGVDIGDGGSTTKAYATVEAISGYVSVVGQVSDYASYIPTSNFTGSAQDVPLTISAGNLPVSSGTQVLLKAGVTYRLSASLHVR